MQPSTDEHSIKINLTAGHPHISAQIGSINANVTYRQEHVAAHRQQLIDNGLPASILEGPYVLVFEINCNPGCEKDILSEVSQILNVQNDSGKNKSWFYQVFKKFILTEIKVTFHDKNSKIFVALDFEKFQQSMQQYFSQFNLNTDIRINVEAEGSINYEKTEQYNSNVLLDYLNIGIRANSAKQISALFKNPMMVELSQDHQFASTFLGVTPTLKKAEISLKMNSLLSMAKLSNFAINEYTIQSIPLFENRKGLIQNELGVHFFKKGEISIKAIIRTDHLEFLLNRYLNQILSNIP